MSEASKVIGLKPSGLQAALKSLIPRRSLCLNISGPPGVGKSSIVKQVANDLGMEFVDIRAVLLDPVDLRGVPSVERKTTRFNPPCFLPQEGCKDTIVFLDELDKAPMLTQCGLLQYALDRKIGEYVSPPNVTIIAAMNRQSDRAGSQKLNTALANRFIHLHLQEDKEEWKKWAIESDIHQSVRAYLDFRPSHLLDFDPSRPGNAFASPRSWEFLSTALKSLQASGVGGEVLAAAISGCVGEGVGAEFSTFLRVYDKLPDVEGMLKNPAKAKIPGDASIRCAIMSAAVDIYRRSPEVKLGLMEVLGKLPVEYTLIGVRDAATANTNFSMDNPKLKTWIKENAVTLKV